MTAGAGPDGRLDDRDAAVLSALRRATEVIDPVPSSLVERVAFDVALHELEAEVATLLARDAGLVGARTGGEPTSSLTFSSSELVVSVLLGPVRNGHRRIDGWLAGHVPADAPAIDTVDAVQADGEVQTTTPSSQGRFSFAAVESGMVRLTLHRAGEQVLQTPSFEL